jgi:hypothetical protein
MMEKYGIEEALVVDDDHAPLVKIAGEHPSHMCEHPADVVVTEGDTRFCQKCQKYLVVKSRGSAG